MNESQVSVPLSVRLRFGRAADDPAATSRDERNWHFYVDDDIASAASTWDPDSDPQRFASGLGHNLLELCVRLRARGVPVTIGTSIPKDARLVVYFQQAWTRGAEFGLAMRAAPFRTVVIRSDAPLWWWNLLAADLVVVPNRAGVRIWTERLASPVAHLPALPQRGMIKRDRAREGIRTLVFKGNPESPPGYLNDPGFRAALEERGVDVVLDIPTRTDGGHQRWHDFHDADIVLCTRGAAPDDSLLNKPATRLINAWCAGAIPLVGPEPAYLELVNDAVDGFVVHGPEDVLGIIDRLMLDEDLARRILDAARERGADFRVSALMERWTAALATVAGPRRGGLETAGRRMTVISRFAAWGARATLRRVVKLARQEKAPPR